MKTACRLWYLLLRGIETLDDVRDSIEITPLLTTSDSAYSKVDVANMESYEKEEGDIDGPFNIGVYITEELEDNTTEIIYYSSSQSAERFCGPDGIWIRYAACG